MSFLSKPFQQEQFSYSSEKAKSILIEDIKKTFSGTFISDDEFYVTSKKSSVFFSDSGSSGHNSLKGKITTQNGKAIIDLIVKPVPRIYIEIFAPIFFGLLYLCYIIFYSANISLSPLLYSSIFIVIIPFATMFLGQTAKDKLRTNFADTLNLSKI